MSGIGGFSFLVPCRLTTRVLQAESLSRSLDTLPVRGCELRAWLDSNVWVCGRRRSGREEKRGRSVISELKLMIDSIYQVLHLFLMLKQVQRNHELHQLL